MIIYQLVAFKNGNLCADCDATGFFKTIEKAKDAIKLTQKINKDLYIDFFIIPHECLPESLTQGENYES